MIKDRCHYCRRFDGDLFATLEKFDSKKDQRKIFYHKNCRETAKLQGDKGVKFFGKKR